MYTSGNISVYTFGNIMRKSIDDKRGKHPSSQLNLKLGAISRNKSTKIIDLARNASSYL